MAWATKRHLCEQKSRRLSQNVNLVLTQQDYFKLGCAQEINRGNKPRLPGPCQDQHCMPFVRPCQDQHAGRPAPSLGWPGEKKSIGATSRGKRRFSKISWWALAKGNQLVQQAKITGLGARAPRLLGALGPGPGLQNGLGQTD